MFVGRTAARTTISSAISSAAGRACSNVQKRTLSALQSLKYNPEANDFQVLDQLKVPYETEYMPVKNADDAWTTIRDMNVRGAPLIAMVAAIGLAVEVRARRSDFNSVSEAKNFLLERLDYLRTSRPTAVNLFEAADRLEALTNRDLLDAYIAEAEAMLEKDVADNRAIGMHGADAILGGTDSASIRVLTHCNTGSLATAGYGTALGVVRALHERGSLECCYMTETRPYNQGARLTAFEIVSEGMPGCLVTDSMASWLMNDPGKGIDCVVTGADRVVANGDSANKIGTYQLAIAAKYHKVPFYIAAPFTTLDCDTASGADIEIEERAEIELTNVLGMRLAAPDIPAWNPAFDVAPAELISGIITEHGVILPAEDEAGRPTFDVKGFMMEATLK